MDINRLIVCVWPNDVDMTAERFALVLAEFNRRKAATECVEPLSEIEVRSIVVANNGNDSVRGVVL